ncbi:MAG: sulfur carrier protein ThiS [Phycisphaerales bacterium]|nr:sulfur carrier protein ThiS [Phycisphaerales bacterium]
MADITIHLNGEVVALHAGATVADAVAKAAPRSNAYAIEVNQTLVPRREHARRVLLEGDNLELVVLVGGG